MSEEQESVETMDSGRPTGDIAENPSNASVGAEKESTDPGAMAASRVPTDPATEPTLVIPTAEELEGLPPESEPVIRATIIDGIKAIYDPEIPVNIWELGLIYKIEVADNRDVNIEMTLTSPMCPTAQQLVGQVEMAARETPFVQEANVDLVWDPPWDMEKMSEEARLMLGF